MKIMKKALGLVAVGTMAAGGFGYVAPSSDAVVSTVATCSGTKGLGGAKSATVGDGLTDKDNQDVAISLKGVSSDTIGAPTNFGSCSFAAGLGTPDGGKPITVNYNGTKALAKWGVKLTSPEADCNSADTGDLTEWPINGKFSMAFTDGKKFDAYVAIDGFTDPDNDTNTPSDVTASHGIVIKGAAAGADVSAELGFTPVVKDKTQTTQTPYPGYQLDLAGALGCTTPTVGDANVLGIVTTDGASIILALPAAGLSLTKGS